MIRLLLILMLAAAVPLAAQNASSEGGRDTADMGDVPADHRPPPGMCRIWIDGVPAARQPAPTDCSTAIRRRPPNAKVVFGKELKDRDRAPVRIPGLRPLVDDRRKQADTDRAPAARRDRDRDRDVPPNLVPIRARDTSAPASDRSSGRVLRPKDERPSSTRVQPQSRPEVRQPERRREPRAEPRQVQPRTSKPRDSKPSAKQRRRIDPGS